MMQIDFSLPSEKRLEPWVIAKVLHKVALDLCPLKRVTALNKEWEYCPNYGCH